MGNCGRCISKKKKDIQIGKEIKLSSLEDAIIICLGTPMESTKKKKKTRTNKFSNVAENKTNSRQ